MSEQKRYVFDEDSFVIRDKDRPHDPIHFGDHIAALLNALDDVAVAAEPWGIMGYDLGVALDRLKEIRND